jgi:hypothetical protein
MKRNISDIEDFLGEFLSGYNLGNPKIRKLYEVLTGDTIHTESFWQRFTGSATRRNHIVHAGRTATEAEARDSHRTATECVEHLTEYFKAHLR